MTHAPTEGPDLLTSLEAHHARRSRSMAQVIVVAGFVLTAVTNLPVAVAWPGWTALHPGQQVGLALTGLAMLGVAPALAAADRWQDGALVDIVAGCSVVALSYVLDVWGLAGVVEQQWARLEVGLVVVLVSTYAVAPARRPILLAATMLPLLASIAHRLATEPLALGVPLAVGDASMYVVGIGAWVHAQQMQRIERGRLRAHIEDLAGVQRVAVGVGEGDLRPPSDDVPESIRAMVARLSELIAGTRRLASSVAAATEQLASMAVQQAGGAAEQASAIAETRATVSDVAREAADIEAAAERSSEAAREAAERSGALVGALDALFATTGQVEGLLRAVRQIADRSDLLALNASLEGVRAGEPGRGFLVVAEHMQALSGQVRATVGELQQLNGSIRDTSEQARIALAGSVEAVDSAQRAMADIRTRTARQDDAMRQVEHSVAEIAEVTHRVAAGTEQLQAAVLQIRGDMEQLEGSTARFRLSEVHDG